MKIRTIAAAVMLALLASPPLAAEFTVNMVNKDAAGRVMQFEPAFVKIAPGDIVHFVAVDKGHDTESIAMPDGAQGWKGKMSQNLDVTFNVEGLYAFKCAPHLPMGMVGLIQVGAAGSADAINALKLPGKAKTRMGELLAEQAAAP